MNSEEQTLIDGLFSRLQQAETDAAPRDAQAEARIKEHLTRQPAAGYFMTQAILVQEAALKSLDQQNKQQAQQIQQLQAELQHAKSQAPAPSGGGFLSSIFGGGSRDSQPAPNPNPNPNPGAAPASGGWREPARPSFNSPAPQQSVPAQQGNAAQPQAPSFLGGALRTAAGVAGGVMLAEGISSLFHGGHQPQEIVEIIREEPAQANDQNGNDQNANDWSNDQQMAGNDTSDQGNFSDADFSDNSSSFFGGDDDSFI
ncbi:MAG: DUF2076 domain-containing protein [Pseudomonas prosekii]